MGIYNSKGFNWERYEEIPEKTNVVWFRNDPYTEITFREFVRIIDLYYNDLDVLTKDIHTKIMQYLYEKDKREKQITMGNETITLPYELNKLKSEIYSNLQYISPGLTMTFCLIFAIFYYGKQMAEVVGYKKTEDCVFDLTRKQNTISEIFSHPDMALARDRVKGLKTIYGVKITNEHIFSVFRGIIGGEINNDDRLNALLYCYNPCSNNIKLIEEQIKNFYSYCNQTIDADKMQEILTGICSKSQMLIKDKAIQLFTTLMSPIGVNDIPEFWTCAVGSGIATSTILGLRDFALLLYNYKYEKASTSVTYLSPTSNKHSITNIDVKTKDVLHIESFGIDTNDSITLKIIINGQEKTFALDKKNNIVNNEDIVVFYEQRGSQKVAVAKLYIKEKDIFIYEDNSVSIELESNFTEDAFLYVTKIKDYRNTEFLLYYNTFKSAEFSLTDLKMRDLYNANKDVFDDIAKKVRDGFTIEPNLTGEFVGKPAQTCMYSDKDVEADKDYRLGYEGSTIIDEGLDNENLRMSRVVIKTDFENKKLMVNIVSHTSPRKVNLTLTESEYENDWGAISHNQVLAMLRSMGMFEAICFILYSLSINVDIKEKIERTLNYSCVCDKTGTSRNIPCLNIKKNIKYNDFLKIDGDTERIIKELNLN